MKTVDGSITGKNEQERKAAAYTMFKNDYSNVESLEFTYKEKANKLSIAQIHLNCVRDCIRIEEIALKGQ